MNFDNFKKELIARLKDEIDERYSIEIRPINKNNGTVKTGIIINTGADIAPTIYAEDLYQYYISGTAVGQIVKKCLSQIDLPFDTPKDINNLRDYKKIKGRLFLKLINKEKNTYISSTCPHMDFLDLCIVLIYREEESSTSMTATATVNYNLFKEWKISEEEAFAAAAANNLLKYPPEVLPLKEVILPLIKDNDLLHNYLSADDYFTDLLFLSCRGKRYGAIAMTYPNLLEAIANDLGDSFYIIPSSIHELLILKADKQKSRNNIDVMVQEVNREALPYEEFLSDHAYFFDANSGKILY